ncbi:MAG: YjgP/YjgQ family permease [Firmicutes bacterium]|nr:YjgP/YjgQ family permease [Bacillota bacterium]
MRTLDLYLTREFSGPFLFCIFGFTVVLLSGLLFQLTDLIFVNKVAVHTVAQMLLYRIPETVVMTLPISTLFATLLAVGRLVQDSEMTIMRASGVSFPRLMAPILILGLLISLFTYWASEKIVPEANHRFENLLRQIIFSEGIPLVEENVFFHGGEQRYFYIEEVQRDTGELKNILVYELGQNSFPRIISAKTGLLEENVWALAEGVIQELDDDGFVQFESRFQRMEIVTEQEGEIFLGNQRTSDEMNRKELGELITHFQKGGRKVLHLVVDYHMKLALPMASFVFALFGAPLALKGKGGRSFGIVVSLIILLFYYVSISVSRSLGVNEVLPPLVSAWLVNSLFALAGFGLIICADSLR